MPLNRFRFLLLAIIGLGMVPPNVIATDYVQLDGSQFERIQKPSRQFTLAGRFDARSPSHLDRLRGDVEALLDRDLVGQQQPLVLRYQKIINERALTDVAQIVVAYQGGLEGKIDNYYAEESSLVFKMFLPNIIDDRESAVALTANASVSNVNRIALRNAAGAWGPIGTGASGGSVYAVAKGNDGKYYIAGDFTSFNGVANTARICSYDPVTGTVAALGTGAASGTVWDLQVAPNGEIWAVGTFANMGGVAAADFVAYWDGSAWNAPGTPPTVSATNPLVPAGGAFDTSGNFYLAAATTTISKWTRATNTWATIAACTGVALTTTRAPDGNIIFAGTLSVVDGVAGGPVYKYTVATDTFTSLGTPGYAVTSLAYDAAGNLYTGGSIVLSRYNGAMWVNLATISGGTAAMSKITYNPVSFLLYGSGAFTQVGSVTPPDSFVVWDGSAVQYPDIDLPGTAGTTYVTVVKAFADGSVVVGLDASGTATAAASTVVTNTGAVRTYPTLVIKGPTSGTARLYNLRNVTTGREIMFNITLNAGETLTIDLNPATLSLLSDFQGDLSGGVLSGSNIADFFLQPGANTITFLSGSSTITIAMRWHNQYASLNQLTL